MLGQERLAVMHEHRALEGVFQFTHVAGPGVCLQKVQRFRADGAKMLLLSFRFPPEHELGQGDDVIAPLAQGNDF